jgi:hypothetical protein
VGRVVKRSLSDFLEKELVFEHLRTIYRHFLKTGGYERGEMVSRLVAHLEGPQAASVWPDLTSEETDLLYVLRQVGGVAPRGWLFRELAARGDRSAEHWKRVFWNLRRRHVTYLVGSDIAYLPEGISRVIGKAISGEPCKRESDVIPGASAARQSVHGLVVALANYVHQSPPRVIADDGRVWKRDLEAMADFFHSYLQESAAGESSIGLVRGRVQRLVELFRKMGFLEKRGKRIYLDASSWSDWTERAEIERQSLLLSFLKDHYENIPLTLEALVDWKDAEWVSIDRLTEAVGYRALRSAFHVLRVRPQAEVRMRSPGRRWVSACVHLLADLGLAYTGSDPNGEFLARPTDSAIVAWNALESGKMPRRRGREVRGPRAYAQPNFELLIPEECSPVLHRAIGSVAELRSLDRFWTYVLTPSSVARGVEEGCSADRAVELLEELVEGALPSNVRGAVSGWARTVWWVGANGKGTFLHGETALLDAILGLEGGPGRWMRENSGLRPLVPRQDAEQWLEEHGIRVVGEAREAAIDASGSRETYARVVDAWKRRLDQGGQGTPAGSTWDDVVPVEPLPQAGRP